jgi:hypothetical protein
MLTTVSTIDPPPQVLATMVVSVATTLYQRSEFVGAPPNEHDGCRPSFVAPVLSPEIDEPQVIGVAPEQLSFSGAGGGSQGVQVSVTRYWTPQGTPAKPLGATNTT